jgi:hypothetical protein
MTFKTAGSIERAFKWFMHIIKEVSDMSKAQDTKKDKKKQPQKTAKEKKQAKREKKNA